MSQQASPGRIVFYSAMDGNGHIQAMPAIVTSVHPGDRVNLYTFPDPDLDVMGGTKRAIPLGGAAEPCTWYWPPRVG